MTLVLLWNQVQDWGMAVPQWSFGLLLAILGIGLPVALYLAWNYERSPEGFFDRALQFDPDNQVAHGYLAQNHLWYNWDFEAAEKEYRSIKELNYNYIAYSSNESGQFEAYVQPFPPNGSRWTVSSDGGEEPIWSPKGDKLYYRSS